MKKGCSSPRYDDGMLPSREAGVLPVWLPKVMLKGFRSSVGEYSAHKPSLAESGSFLVLGSVGLSNFV